MVYRMTILGRQILAGTSIINELPASLCGYHSIFLPGQSSILTMTACVGCLSDFPGELKVAARAIRNNPVLLACCSCTKVAGSNVIPSGKPVVAYWKQRSKYMPINFELARALSTSIINFHYRNVGNPIIALTLIEAPSPKYRVNLFHLCQHWQ